jgi:hypothetical protein
MLSVFVGAVLLQLQAEVSASWTASPSRVEGEESGVLWVYVADKTWGELAG